MRATLLIFATFVLVLGCDQKSSQASFCTTYKANFIRRCADSCLTALEKPTARPACEQQCQAVLPTDPTYAASCASEIDKTRAAAAPDATPH